MFELCSMCLSGNRRLLPVISLKYLLDSLSWFHILDTEHGRLCWECSAMLIKIHRFQQQVLRAQSMLALHKNAKQPAEALKSLSTLSTCIKMSFDETVLYHEAVKHEIEEFDSYEYLQEELANVEKDDKNEDDYSILAVKHENNEETKFSDINEEINEQSLSENKDLNKSPEESDTFHHLSKDEQKFIVTRMSIDEMYRVRDLERNGKRYKSNPYKCTKCIKSFFTEKNYDSHMDNYHSSERGARMCSVCSARFSRADALRQHHEAHFKRYRCRACPYSHHRLPAMLAHARAQHELATYACKLCHKEFDSPRRLRYHADKAHRARPACGACGKTFVTAHSLKLHVLGVHKNNGLLEECPQCGGRFRQLRVHMRTHAPAAGEDAYCAECDRQFRSVYIYRSHLRMHANHRQADALKHPCAHCDARFSNKTNLARHVTSKHTKEYPFVCDVCGKGWNRKDRLQFHIQEHHEGVSRPKNKICTYCGKAFKDAQVLKNHIRTHTGEKPYACELCPWRFAQRTALKTHVRALHHKQKRDAAK